MSQIVAAEETGSPPAPLTQRAPGAKQVSFTPAELEAFQQEDKHAAGAVAGIMLGIFALALVMYTIIAVVASRGP